MNTYGDVLALWEFTFFWLLQAHPTNIERLQVLRLFEGLGLAIHHDTGIENFRLLANQRERRLGQSTRETLERVRPELIKLYPYFEGFFASPPRD